MVKKYTGTLRKNWNIINKQGQQLNKWFKEFPLHDFVKNWVEVTIVGLWDVIMNN